MTVIKLASALPGGDSNGLSPLVRDLIDNPHDMHVVVALVDCKQVTTDNDSGDVVPTARVRRIEAIRNPADGARITQLLRRAYEDRTGQTVLPLDLEDELQEVIDRLGVDPKTGELPPDA